LATLGALLVAGFLLTAVLAPWLAPRDPYQMNLRGSLKPPGAEYLLGADYGGRDVLSRIIYGARLSSIKSISSVGLGMVVGTIMGMLAGWYDQLEGFIMRIVDLLLCFPSIIIALSIIAILGAGLENVIIAIVVGQIPNFARLAHGLTSQARNRLYVESARSIGARDFRILSRHVFPNIMDPLIVQLTLSIPGAIMTAAALSFLGLGVSPPTATWGGMLHESLKWGRSAPHVAVYPGIALMLVVFGFNTMGDGLRRALDPRARKAGRQVG